MKNRCDVDTDGRWYDATSVQKDSRGFGMLNACPVRQVVRGLWRPARGPIEAAPEQRRCRDEHTLDVPGEALLGVCRQQTVVDVDDDVIGLDSVGLEWGGPDDLS